MDINASLRLVLYNEKDTFDLTGPCVCCGKSSDGIWTYNQKYDLEHWVADSRGRPVKQGYKDKDGKTAQGEVELNLPYCTEHLEQSRRLHKYHSNQKTLMAIIMVIAVIFYCVSFADWIFAGETNKDVGFRMFAIPIFVSVVIAGLGSYFFTTINKGLSKRSEYIDYPIDSEDGGGSGLAIKVEGEEAGMIGQHRRYFLSLDFKNVEAAKRFKQKYPEALIIEGIELLDE